MRIGVRNVSSINIIRKEDGKVMCTFGNIMDVETEYIGFSKEELKSNDDDC